jgi:mRNA interferase RelE/StbE
MGAGKEGSRFALSRYSVEIRPQALKHLLAIPNKERLRIIGAIELLRDNPIPPKAIKLKGREGYRIRVGNYRIIYSFNATQLIILVVDIGHRREIY